jgi:thymidylate synthase
MMTVSARSATDLFTIAASQVLTDGGPTEPRGLPTVEVLGAELRLEEPRRRLVHVPQVRRLNPAFAIAEAVWILSGSDEPWIYDFNRQLTRYADDGILQGAYGPRLRRWRGTVDQLDVVRRKLLDDPDTRQAVIQLFDPERDHRGHKDVPCTLGFRFFLRDGRLHMHTTMRSQDLWLGFPYDVFTFSVLHELMAGWVGADLGEYRHTIDSLHLYATNWDAARTLNPQPLAEAMAPLAVAWEDFDDVLAAVVKGDSAALVDAAWADFATVLTTYRLWRAGERESARVMAGEVGGSLGVSLRDWYVYLDVPEAVSS